MALFPRSILDNIGIIFTHVDPLTSNFKENSLPLQLQGVKRWHIQNPLALLTNHNSHAQNANYGVEESSEVVDTIKHTHQKTISTLNRWLEWINCRTVQPTTEIIKLYEAGSEILTHINAMIADSAELSKKYQELEEIEAEMQSNQKDQNRWNDRLHQILQQKPGWTTEKTESWNTICWEPDCHSNCHIDCNENGFWCSIGWMCEQFSLQGPQVCMVAGLAAAVAAYGDVEDAMNMGSAAGSEISVLSNCSSCNHPVDSHKRSQRKHVEGRPDPAPFVSADDASRAEGNRLEASRTLIATELEAIRNQITHNFTSIQESTEKFRSLSLNCHFADHLVSNKRLLEVRKKALRPGPGFEDHVKSIDESIEKLEQQLKVLRSPPTFNPKEKETV
ncbi:hypothetical protein RSOLAG1IB_10000 [Rhizoctonia solani AG-1 IB]|uniref:Uncharacterized protein n=1 Tax=Thanatephorus cucumeris (strain AG1-IB / isolate 7/3/14) TaxID=1108050 RepID=A0A0B7FYS0_THACB|nr:hypothetical protein RSOLAG1IB_10000 [Rhizoctonia solani AG-1 IB]